MGAKELSCCKFNQMREQGPWTQHAKSLNYIPDWITNGGRGSAGNTDLWPPVSSRTWTLTVKLIWLILWFWWIKLKERIKTKKRTKFSLCKQLTHLHCFNYWSKSESGENKRDELFKTLRGVRPRRPKSRCEIHQQTQLIVVCQSTTQSLCSHNKHSEGEKIRQVQIMTKWFITIERFKTEFKFIFIYSVTSHWDWNNLSRAIKYELKPNKKLKSTQKDAKT